MSVKFDWSGSFDACSVNLAGTLGLLTTKELLSELKSTCGSFVEVEGHLENVKLVGREHRVGIIIGATTYCTQTG